MDVALDYVKKAGGVTAEQAWDFSASFISGTQCEFGRDGLKPVVTLGADFAPVTVPPGSEAALRRAAALQPVAVGMDSSCSEFMNYGGGPYHFHSPSSSSDNISG